HRVGRVRRGARARDRRDEPRALGALRRSALRRARSPRVRRHRSRRPPRLKAREEPVPKEKRSLSSSEVAVSDVIGRLIEFWGFKRNMGRIWAVLYLSSEPLSAEDLR